MYTDFGTNLKPLNLGGGGRLMNLVEVFEVYKEFKSNPGNLLNDQLSFQPDDRAAISVFQNTR